MNQKIMYAIFLIICMFPSVSRSSNSSSTPRTIKVLTLNTWLLSVLGHPIGKDISVRASIIPKAIVDTGADLIAMQEVWSNQHKKLLATEFEAMGYPYSFFNKRKMGMGNGLMIVSKCPILSAEIAPIFKKHTRLDEKMANKRGIYAEIKISDDLVIDFFTVHMGALTYDTKLGNYNRIEKARQRDQYVEFKAWIQSMRKHPVSIIAGDFNADYRTLSGGRFLPDYADDYLELIDHACGESEDMMNSFLVANKMDQRSVAIPTYSTENPYVAGGLFANAPSETEDYIYSCGIEKESILESAVIFKEAIDSQLGQIMISDHFGLTSAFRLK